LDRWLYARGLKSTNGLSLPDFVGIGAQKAGTSWLHENLRHHPDAFVPAIKEVHYFDESFDQPLGEYAKFFSEGAKKIKGEITPAYSILPRMRIAFIRAVMPEVRLLFMMRNPIDRAWSHALMTLITQGGRKYEDVREEEFLAHFNSDANLDRGDYFGILTNWLSVFPPEQMFLGYFEDISANPVGLLRDACRHIGLSTDLDWETFPYREKVYPGPQIEMPGEFRRYLAKVYGPKIEQLRPILGAAVDRWLDSGAGG
jgi:hypothetical protein